MVNYFMIFTTNERRIKKYLFKSASMHMIKSLKKDQQP